MFTETMDLTAEGNVRPVNLTARKFSKEGVAGEPEVIQLELIEMDYISQEKYMDQNRRRLEFKEGGKAMVKNFEGMRMELLTKALRYADSKKMITPKFFEEYRIPGGTMQKLYLAAQEMNHPERDVETQVESMLESIIELAKNGSLTEVLRDKLRAAIETEAIPGE